MAETIFSQFRETGLSPTISIRGVDGTVYVNAAAMTEVSGGWYKYEFTTYDKTIQYLIDAVNGDETQSTTNTLDGYENKSDWFGPRGGTIVYGLKEEEIKKTIDDILSKIEPNGLSDALVTRIELLQKAIEDIRIPEMPNIKVGKQGEVIDYKKIEKMIAKEAKNKSEETKSVMDGIMVNIMLLDKANQDLAKSQEGITAKAAEKLKEKMKSDNLLEIKKQLATLEKLMKDEEDNDIIDVIKGLLGN